MALTAGDGSMIQAMVGMNGSPRGALMRIVLLGLTGYPNEMLPAIGADERLRLLRPDYARDVATRFDKSGDFSLGKKVCSLLVCAPREEYVLAT
jgi:hypothetical protein